MKPKGRPKKARLVEKQPQILRFSPRGRPGRPDEIGLKMDEFEALRLIDSKGLKQVQAAKLMGLSQQTFSRILRQARKKLASVVVEGKIASIEKEDYIKFPT